jgi:hypothetical protein
MANMDVLTKKESNLILLLASLYITLVLEWLSFPGSDITLQECFYVRQLTLLIFYSAFKIGCTSGNVTIPVS